MLQVTTSTQFRRDIKRLRNNKKILAEIDEVINLLASENKLPERYHDHALAGDFGGYRECQIRPDLLLIYRIIDEELELYLLRVGSHSELFE